jgi:hypothetical protein
MQARERRLRRVDWKIEAPLGAISDLLFMIHVSNYPKLSTSAR